MLLPYDPTRDPEHLHRLAFDDLAGFLGNTDGIDRATFREYYRRLDALCNERGITAIDAIRFHMFKQGAAREVALRLFAEFQDELRQGCELTPPTWRGHG